ncbi:gliding motility lipoprotein GldH [Geofilum sp. OHC36d9]|uniref:gliding motility lipoprotein GldH n=1 Tax=Geofilum sp. OHC36d9 TaxID=3458413 RepID=UPI0040344E19
MKISWLLGLVLLFAACGPKIIYEKQILFGPEGWNMNQPAVFEMTLSDTTDIMDFGLTFNHGNNYPYSNLWVFLTIQGPNGVQKKDTLEMILATVDGQWLGEKSGGEYSLSAAFQPHVRLAEPGLYRFEVQQGMRNEILNDFKSVSFWVR